MEEESKPKKSYLSIIIIIILLIVIIAGVCWYIFSGKDLKENNTPVESNTEKNNGEEKVQGEETEKYSRLQIKDNSLVNFDLEFLKLENEEKNKIYSPISIKYALAMLKEGAEGNTKKQIENIIGKYQEKIYHNSDNISFANAFFIRNTFKNDVKEKFINNLKEKYGADVEFDSFSSANNINSWISDKTFNLINNMLDDKTVSDLDFALVNALAIDMEWEDKFLDHIEASGDYAHEKFSWIAPESLVKGNFENLDNDISGMQVIASINNYDIVNEIGEDKIREDVGNAYKSFLEKNSSSDYPSSHPSVDEFLDDYIKEINSNYKDVSTNTDFSFYVDDDIKAFGKDLKSYDGVQLEYVAIMPKQEDLTEYVKNTDADKISQIIGSLKELKSENFDEGKITAISGFIPKFKFDYQLDLINDLQELGIKDVFDEKKANLDGITEGDAYIGNASHKADIEFTEDGIKAAAATVVGGMGAGSDFDYFYEVPVEKIDLTFDKPYMFLIRDKESGEVWFTGTVYEPLSFDEEPKKDEIYDGKMSEFSINDIDTIWE